MSEENETYYHAISVKLSKLSSLIFLILGTVFNEFFISMFDSNPPLNHLTVLTIRSVQIIYVIIAVFLFSLAILIQRASFFKAVFEKSLSAKILLFLLTLGIPLTIIDFGLRPVALQGKTYIFMEDDELVWKNRPNAVDNWGDVIVEINSKGCRGPEIEYAKPDGVLRILHLGDSVPFGYLLEDYNLTFPAIIEKILEERTGDNIETVNLGVGGYSTWQENILFQREGIKYEPDLVILSFVLNDATNKFNLKRFGGSSENGLLELGLSSKNEQWYYKSGILYLTRRIGAHFLFGKEVQKGANLIEINKVKSLIESPDHPEVKAAWEGVFKDIQQIVGLCNERSIEFLLVVFPFSLQLKSDGNEFIPQSYLINYAEEHDIQYLDILDFMKGLMKEKDTVPNDYFLDYYHLNPWGNQLVAEHISESVINNGMVPDVRENKSR